VILRVARYELLQGIRPVFWYLAQASLVVVIAMFFVGMAKTDVAVIEAWWTERPPGTIALVDQGGVLPPRLKREGEHVLRFGRRISLRHPVRSFDTAEAALEALGNRQVMSAIILQEDGLWERTVPRTWLMAPSPALEAEIVRAVHVEYQVAAGNLSIETAKAGAAPAVVEVRLAENRNTPSQWALWVVAALFALAQLTSFAAATGAIEAEVKYNTRSLMLSAVRPFDLFIGKLVGRSAEVILLLCVWWVVVSLLIFAGPATQPVDLSWMEMVGAAMFTLMGIALYACIGGGMVLLDPRGGETVLPAILLTAGLPVLFGMAQGVDGTLMRVAQFIPSSATLAATIRLLLGSPTSTEVMWSGIVWTCSMAIALPVCARLYMVGLFARTSLGLSAIAEAFGRPLR